MLTKSKNFLEKPVTNIRLEWRQGTDTTEAWNDICIWAIEQFGLPGNRFTWHATESHMDFDFTDEKDAIHFMLRWS
jgi:hypothetical protein